MNEFDEEGIRKLVDAMDGDVTETIDQLKDSIDAAKSYKTYTKIKDGAQGTVKFIIKSE